MGSAWALGVPGANRVDGQRFDAITKAMARGASRRGALRALTGSVAVGLAGLVGRGVEPLHLQARGPTGPSPVRQRLLGCATATAG